LPGVGTGGAGRTGEDGRVRMATAELAVSTLEVGGGDAGEAGVGGRRGMLYLEGCVS